MKQDTSKTFVVVLFCIAGLWSQTQAQKSTMREQVYFATGEHELDEAAKAVLDGLVAHGETQVIYGVKVAGHTDDVGSGEDNKALSQRRALEVARYLRDYGVNAKAVRLKAFGEDRAVADNETNQGRKLNRRVELKIYLGPMIEEEPIVEADTEEFGGGFYEEEKPEKPKDLKINGNVGNYDCETGLEMTGRRGVKIEVPPGAFGDCSEEMGPITVKLLEYTKFENVVGKNVSTLTGDGQLESAGMICLDAYADKQQLQQLAKGLSVTVRIPAQKFDPNMILYNANQDNDVSTINWQANPNGPLGYDEETDSYVFTTNQLTCINLDKPVVDTQMVAIRVKKGMLHNANMYLNYKNRGTFSQGKNKGERYIVFGSTAAAEAVRLKGFLSTGKQLYRIDKSFNTRLRTRKIVYLEGKKYYVVANVTRRGIGRRDHFVTRKGSRAPAYGFTD